MKLVRGFFLDRRQLYLHDCSAVRIPTCSARVARSTSAILPMIGVTEMRTLWFTLRSCAWSCGVFCMTTMISSLFGDRDLNTLLQDPLLNVRLWRELHGSAFCSRRPMIFPRSEALAHRHPGSTSETETQTEERNSDSDSAQGCRLPPRRLRSSDSVVRNDGSRTTSPCATPLAHASRKISPCADERRVLCSSLHMATVTDRLKGLHREKRA